MWKLFWDIAAVIVGLYAGYKTFLFSGGHISAFGYFPIGILLGLLVFGVAVLLTHFLELAICWLVWKLFKVKIEKNLPF